MSRSGVALQLGSNPDHVSDDVRPLPSSLLLDDVATLFLETALAVAPLLKSIKDQFAGSQFLLWRHFPQCLSPMTVCPNPGPCSEIPQNENATVLVAKVGARPRVSGKRAPGPGPW